MSMYFVIFLERQLYKIRRSLSVCVLLINLQTGQIENAAKCSIDDATATSIVPLSQNQPNIREIAR